jgi:hypothetical protein
MSGLPASKEVGARDMMSQSQGESQGKDTSSAAPQAQQEGLLLGQQAAKEAPVIQIPLTSVEEFAMTIATGGSSPYEGGERPAADHSPPPPGGLSPFTGERDGGSEKSLEDYNDRDPGTGEHSHSEHLRDPGMSAEGPQQGSSSATPQAGISLSEIPPVGDPAAGEHNAPATGSVLNTVFASELARLDQDERLSLGLNPQGQLSDRDQQTLRELRS